MYLNEDKFEYISGTTYYLKQLLISSLCALPLFVLPCIFLQSTLTITVAVVFFTITVLACLNCVRKIGIERKVVNTGTLAIATVECVSRKYKKATTKVYLRTDGHICRMAVLSRRVNVKEGDKVRVMHLNYKYVVPEGNCGAGKFKIWKDTLE